MPRRASSSPSLRSVTTRPANLAAASSNRGSRRSARSTTIRNASSRSEIDAHAERASADHDLGVKCLRTQGLHDVLGFERPQFAVRIERRKTGATHLRTAEGEIISPTDTEVVERLP